MLEWFFAENYTIYFTFDDTELISVGQKNKELLSCCIKRHDQPEKSEKLWGIFGKSSYVAAYSHVCGYISSS